NVLPTVDKEKAMSLTQFPRGAPGQSEIRAPLRRLLSAWLTSVVSSSPVPPPQ
ncbi:DNA polymerase III PolC-type, partial [Dissostichus eleginoides]